MRTEQPTKCLFHISCARKTSLSPRQFITDRSKAVVLMWSLLAVLVSVSVMFHFMFVHYTFCSVWVTEWPPFGK